MAKAKDPWLHPDLRRWTKEELETEVLRLRATVHALNVAIGGLSKDIDSRASMCVGSCGAFPPLRSTVDAPARKKGRVK